MGLTTKRERGVGVRRGGGWKGLVFAGLLLQRAITKQNKVDTVSIILLRTI